MSPIDETALLEAAQAGDVDAYEQLQRHFEPQIRRFVRRLMGSSYAEDDVVQDVFVALFCHKDRIQPASNLRPYLFRMARNRCYDEFRRGGRNQQVSLDDEPMEMWVSFTATAKIEDKPDEVAHWLLLHLEVREAMDRLPELQRQALILYSEEELSYAEIADVMQTSVGTIKSRLHHAKKALRGLLRPGTLAALEDEFSAG